MALPKQEVHYFIDTAKTSYNISECCFDYIESKYGKYGKYGEIRRISIT